LNVVKLTDTSGERAPSRAKEYSSRVPFATEFLITGTPKPLTGSSLRASGLMRETAELSPNH